MKNEYTLAERQLIVELSVGITRRLTEALKLSNPDLPGYIFHGFEAVLENSFSILWSLKIATAPEGQNTFSHENFDASKKAVPANIKCFSEVSIRNSLNQTLPYFSDLIPELLSNYISLACVCGSENSMLSHSKKAFTPQEEYKSEIRELLRSGYLTKVGHAVRWTERIAQIMQRAYLWNNETQVYEELNGHKASQNSIAAIHSTPKLVQKRIARDSRGMSELEFVSLLRDKYDGLYIRKDTVSIRALKAIYSAYQRM